MFTHCISRKRIKKSGLFRSLHFDDVTEHSDLVTINRQEAVNDEAWELGIETNKAK